MSTVCEHIYYSKLPMFCKALCCFYSHSIQHICQRKKRWQHFEIFEHRWPSKISVATVSVSRRFLACASDGNDASDASFAPLKLCVTCVTCDPVMQPKCRMLVTFTLFFNGASKALGCPPSTKHLLGRSPNPFHDWRIVANFAEIMIKRDKGGWVARCHPAEQQPATADSGTVSYSLPIFLNKYANSLEPGFGSKPQFFTGVRFSLYFGSQKYKNPYVRQLIYSCPQWISS